MKSRSIIKCLPVGNPLHRSPPARAGKVILTHPSAVPPTGVAGERSR